MVDWNSASLEIVALIEVETMILILRNKNRIFTMWRKTFLNDLKMWIDIEWMKWQAEKSWRTLKVNK